MLLRPSFPQPKSANREIGAAQQGFLHATVVHMAHLAMKEAGSPDFYGADLHQPADPVGTVRCDDDYLLFLMGS
ncbi:MAG: hypothetical protein GXY61_04480 [Lentisphaerae bacterium]|jgi:hypothetical protein|nr:hypothetical protein [Lentisphaerota bacterium]